MKNQLLNAPEPLLGNNPFLVKDIHDTAQIDCPFRTGGGCVCLCTSGEADIAINTEVYHVRYATEIVCLSDELLMVKNCSEDFRMTTFLCSRKIVAPAMHKFDSIFFAQIAKFPIYNNAKGEEQVMISYLTILRSLQHDIKNQFRNTMAINLMRCIMLNIYDKMKRRGETTSQNLMTHKENIYYRFLDLVNEYSDTHRDVTFYANELCITQRYLGGITQEIGGYSPKQIIDRNIVADIKLMLTMSDLSIQQIADLFHFPDQSYLGRFFKHHTGISPSTYRLQEMDW